MIVLRGQNPLVLAIPLPDLYTRCIDDCALKVITIFVRGLELMLLLLCNIY